MHKRAHTHTRSLLREMGKLASCLEMLRMRDSHNLERNSHDAAAAFDQKTDSAFSCRSILLLLLLLLLVVVVDVMVMVMLPLSLLLLLPLTMMMTNVCCSPQLTNLELLASMCYQKGKDCWTGVECDTSSIKKPRALLFFFHSYE